MMIPSKTGHAEAKHERNACERGTIPPDLFEEVDRKERCSCFTIASDNGAYMLVTCVRHGETESGV